MQVIAGAPRARARTRANAPKSSSPKSSTAQHLFRRNVWREMAVPSFEYQFAFSFSLWYLFASGWWAGWEVGFSFPFFFIILRVRPR